MLFRNKRVCLAIHSRRYQKLPFLWQQVEERLRGVKIRPTRIRDLPKKADLVIVENLYAEKGTLKKLERIPLQRRMLLNWEPPVVDPSAHVSAYHQHFGRVLTIRDDIEDHFHIRSPLTLTQIAEAVPFEKKRLLTMVMTNKSSSHPDQLYSERRAVIEHMEGSDQFDFYGRRWEHLGYRNYRGAPEDKVGVIKNYRFCIAYENTRGLSGYVTEKMFDCFAARCVPIYLGASNVTDYVPKECFISREQFGSMEEMITYLQSMDIATYQHYLDAASDFLTSGRAEPFSYENFITTHTRHIEEMLR